MNKKYTGKNHNIVRRLRITDEFIDIIKRMEGSMYAGEEINVNNFQEAVVAAYYMGRVAESQDNWAKYTFVKVDRDEV